MAVTKEKLIKKLMLGMNPNILEEFLNSSREEDLEWKPVVREVKNLWDAGDIQVTRCYNCGTTGTGSPSFFMSGSVGTLCPDCYDGVEEYM